MSVSKKLLQAAAGQGVSKGLDVDQVFSTFRYDGNGSNQIIENGIAVGNSNDGGSASFSKRSANTNTRVNITTSANFNFGTGDFTIEAFINIKTSKNYHNVYDQRTASQDASTNSPVLYVDNNNYIIFHVGGAGRAFSSALTVGVWYHVAVTRASGSTKMFLNGTQQGSTYSDSLTYVQPASDFSFGGSLEQNSYNLDGYISNLRVVKGTALYTSNFTAPTADLTAVSGTSLLTAQGSTPFIDNSGNSVALTLNNSAHLFAPVASEFGPFTGTDGEGGLVWIRGRGSKNHRLFDTARGVSSGYISSNLTNAANFESDQLTALNSNGFSLGSNGDVNQNHSDYGKYISWTFRKAKKFFDLVTFTGDGTNGRSVSHNLGATPGMIILKRTNSTDDWQVFHRYANDKRWILNSTNAGASTTLWGSGPTSTDFKVDNASFSNESGAPYVAYIFAHNDGDGGFGPEGADIIKCGSYTGNNNDTGPVINLGFEPQFLMIKRASGGTGGWEVYDNIRGVSAGVGEKRIYWDSSSGESTLGLNRIDFNPTGFSIFSTNGNVNASDPYIYMAIRRGPLAEPEDATKVFAIDTQAGSQTPKFDSGFPVDFALTRNVSSTANWAVGSRLIQGKQLNTDNTNAATDNPANFFDYNDGWNGESSSSDNAAVYSWMWKRAPGYFDVVCYDGSGSNRTINHNLGAAPEMMWVKRRDGSDAWHVYHSALGNEAYLQLNSTNAQVTGEANRWNSTTPTASVFSLGTSGSVNGGSDTYIAYLFGTVAGVSKVGSVNITSTSDFNVDCGFSNGARFVMVKAFSASAPWYVSDSVRGINSGSADPLLFFNDSQGTNTATNWIEPHPAGFTIKGSVYNGYNLIFYAIA